jgi:hypothetical protein
MGFSTELNYCIKDHICKMQFYLWKESFNRYQQNDPIILNYSLNTTNMTYADGNTCPSLQRILINDMLLSIMSEWVSDAKWVCYSCIMVRTSYIQWNDDDDVLCIRPTRSLTQLSVGRYIILIPRQQTFAITPYCVVSFNMGWQDNRKCYPALPLGMKY